MLSVGFARKGAGVRPLRRQLSTIGTEINEQLRAVLSAQANVSLERVKALTPIGDRDEENAHIPHTAGLWFLKEFNKPGEASSKGGAAGAYLGVIDHPYNVPGKTRPPIKFQGSNGKTYVGARYMVNDGEHSLLADLEYGTKAHTISAHGVRTRAQSLTKTSLRTKGGKLVRKSLLRFKIGGRVIFTDQVFHPGTRAYSMTRTSAAEADRDLIVAFRKLLQSVQTRMDQGGK